MTEAPLPEVRGREEAFAALRALYERLGEAIARLGPVCRTRGLCCRFEEAGHELFATDLEVDYAAALHPEAPPPEAPGRCPHHRAGLCTAREGRPLGCRVYFCDPAYAPQMPDLHESAYAEIRAIAARAGYAHRYRRFPEALAERWGIGEP
ncbi:MAG TPA: hypothetical protein VFI25_16135 [Planctomycetota bacterium]|nr:hypothetical protein [Planctomycetota bacterium]